MSINLTTPLHSLRAYLSGAVTLNEPNYFVSYLAKRANDNEEEEFSVVGFFSSATPIVLVSPPDGSTLLRKSISEILIHNEDSVSCTVNLAVVIASVEYHFVTKAVGAEQTLHYSPTSGFQLF